MDFFSDNIANLIFKAKTENLSGNISLSPELLNVLSELDGTKDAQAITTILNINMRSLRVILDKLYKLNLIHKIEKSIPLLSPDFFSYLEALLSYAVGPIAKILIRDAIKQLGANPKAIPKYLETDLIELIASKIYIKDKNEAFLKAMKAKSNIKR